MHSGSTLVPLVEGHLASRQSREDLSFFFLRFSRSTSRGLSKCTFETAGPENDIERII